MRWPWVCAGYRFALVAALEQQVAFDDGQARTVSAEPVIVGEEGELSLIVLERPWDPTALELRLSAVGIELPENRLGWEDVVDPQAERPRIRIRVRAPGQPGEALVEGRLRYTTCEGRYCRPRTTSVRWVIPIVGQASSEAR